MVARFVSAVRDLGLHALAVIQVILKAHGAENTRDVLFMFAIQNLAANFG
jgi:hypothetical protein